MNSIMRALRMGKILLKQQKKRRIHINFITIAISVLLIAYLFHFTLFLKGGVLTKTSYLLFGFALFVFCVFAFTKRPLWMDRCQKVWNKVVTFMAPALIFLIVETLAENNLLGIQPQYLIGNLIWYYITYGLLLAILRRPKLAIYIEGTVAYVIGLANFYILNFRGQPIQPWDFASLKTAAGVAGTYNYQFTVFTFWATLLLLVLFYATHQMTSFKVSFWMQKSTKRRIATLGATAFCAAFITVYVSIGIMAMFGGKVYAWKQDKQYRNCGFYFSFMENVRFLRVEKPKGYSVEKVKQIVDNVLSDMDQIQMQLDNDLNSVAIAKKPYSEKSGMNLFDFSFTTIAKAAESIEPIDAEDQETVDPVEFTLDETANDPVATNRPNIIAIMNESFSDLESVKELETSEDYMPFIHGLSQNTVKGTMIASIFGANTCNTEFEFLTGNSMAFLPMNSIPYQQYIKGETSSLVGTLKRQGYACHALHPYYRIGWNRPNVYEGMGFEDFTSLEDFVNPELLREYITDEENYKRLIQMFEAREVGKPFFTFNVTMQNHGSFHDNDIPHEIRIENAEQEDLLITEEYLNLIKASDTAFQHLVEYFSQVTEPTVIIMFGDHQPKLHDSFYDEVDSSTDLETTESKHRVPFVIWANYNIGSSVVDKISANYLSSYLLDLCGLKMTDYNRYLLKLRERIPVLTAQAMYTKEHKWFASNDSTAYDDLLNGYNILQYNNMFGGSSKQSDVFDEIK